MKRSLRWRLAWSFALLCSFAVTIQAIALFVGADEQEEDMIDEVVNVTLDNYLRDSIGNGEPEVRLSSMRMRLFRTPAGKAPAPLPADYAQRPAGNHEWFDRDIEYHVGIRDLGTERVYLMYDVSEHEARLETLQWNLAIGLLALSAISLWLGYWLSGRLLSQLDRITLAVQRDDAAPFSDPELDREVGLLAGALDAYRSRNRELLLREREFTANVSHELRTPLTRIRTSAELLGEDASLAGRSRERAERIVAAVDAMEARLRGLLFLGRELALDERRPLELKRQVETSAAHFRSACDGAGVDLEIDIPDTVTVAADSALLQLLLDNLIGNAVRYTPAGHIRIGYRDCALTIADTGVGIPAEHASQVFERHYRASDVPGGMGIGLSIVRRVCDAHGWECRIKPGSRQGTCVAVRFDARSVAHAAASHA